MIKVSFDDEFRMKYATLFLVIVSVILSYPIGVYAEATCKLGDMRTFGFFLGLSEEQVAEERTKLSEYDLLILDGQEISRKNISELQNDGALVLGYLSVGTIEKGRPWSKRLRKFSLEYWEDWDEWYADVNNRRFQRQIVKRIAKRLLKKGFDGLFLDNIAMIEEFPQQLPGMLKTVRKLRQLSKRTGKCLMAQNADTMILRFVRYLDGWNREDVTFTYDWNSSEYRRTSLEQQNSAIDSLLKLKSLGMPVFITDYVQIGDFTSYDEAKNIACSVGAVPYLGDIFLKSTSYPIVSCE